MNFVRAHKNDLELILSILKSAALELQTKAIPQWTQWLRPKPENINWLNEKINGKAFYFVFINNQQIGMFSLSDSDEKYWETQTENAKYLHSLTILPEFKGLKYGEKVIEKIKFDLKLTDIKYLRLDCISINKTLIKYYQNQQFKFVRQTTIGQFDFLLHQFEL